MNEDSKIGTFAQRLRAPALIPTIALLLAGLGPTPATATDNIHLTMTRGTTPSEVRLAWSGASGPFQVYRSSSPSGLGNSQNLLTLTAATTLSAQTSPPPPRMLFFEVLQAACGDGVVDLNEQCDNGSQNSNTLPNACRTSCRSASCGDGVVDLSEQCDNGPQNSDTLPNACRTSCQSAHCGDGVFDTGEGCDDGNTNDNDNCTAACAIRWNVLLMIADDLGQENIQTYQDAIAELQTVTAATTPNVNQLAANGVTFLNAWSNPTCTPTRAGIYSGFHAFQHQLTAPSTVTLNTSHCGPDSLQEALQRLSNAPALAGVLPVLYKKGLFGKWHVGGDCDPGADGTAFDAPQDLGWDFHDGTFEDLKDDTTGTGEDYDYCSWERVTNGVVQAIDETTYATDFAVDQASAWIDDQLSSPWFATVAFNAPHDPLHVPPNPDPATSCLESVCTDSRVCYLAMVEYMDGAIGRLIAHLEQTGELPYTIVIFIGDNGTERTVYTGSTETDPYGATCGCNHGKGTTYEGGVEVPFIVADGCLMTGNQNCVPLIASPGRYSFNLVQTLDLFATIRGITNGTDDAATYGRPTVNVKPFLLNPLAGNIRSTLYTESDQSCAIRDGRYKIVMNDGLMGTTNDCSATLTGACRFYDLQTDPLETTDLLLGGPLTSGQHNALQGLRAALRTLRGWASGPSCPEPH